MAFTSKQQAFIDAYAGNGTEAARKAGYAGDDNALAVMANSLLRNPKIAAAIKEREKHRSKPNILNREKRQEFWSNVMLDEDQTMKNRLKASELLGKSEADFTEKIVVQGLDELADRLKRSRDRSKK